MSVVGSRRLRLGLALIRVRAWVILLSDFLGDKGGDFLDVLGHLRW